MNEPVVLSDLSVQRYVERVRPTLTLDQAAVEMRRLIERNGRFIAERPGWLPPGLTDPIGFVDLGDVVLPLVRTPESWDVKLVATSAFVRGSIAEAARLTRNRHSSRRNERRASAKRANRGRFHRPEVRRVRRYGFTALD